VIDAAPGKPVIDVSLDGFPQGWALKPGDLVVVDASSHLVSPYVSSSIEGTDLVYWAQNIDKAVRREIARVPLLGDIVA
jgi:hypothetical protein